MPQPTTYRDYLGTLSGLNKVSLAEDVEAAVKRAEALPHWFDRQRAIADLAKRLEVDKDLLFRMMTRGAK